MISTRPGCILESGQKRWGKFEEEGKIWKFLDAMLNSVKEMELYFVVTRGVAEGLKQGPNIQIYI